MSPEQLANRPYGPPVDVWAYGICLWEILTQQVPWGELSGGPFLQRLLEHLEAGHRPVIPSGTPEPYAALMVSCWQWEPSKRPSFAAIVEDPVFVSLDLGRVGPLPAEQVVGEEPA